MYCNVWFAYPVHALDNRDRPSPGQEYPSGGPQQANIAIWKAAAPSIDILAPDFYSDDFTLFHDIAATYARPDNPLMVPESQLGPNFGRYFFYALGHGAIGFAPFGIDYTGWKRFEDDKMPVWLSQNFALFAPIQQQVAEWILQANFRLPLKKKASLKNACTSGVFDAIVSFGYPQRDGEQPPGTLPTCRDVSWLPKQARWNSLSLALKRASALFQALRHLEQAPQSNK